MFSLINELNQHYMYSHIKVLNHHYMYSQIKKLNVQDVKLGAAEKSN